MDQIAALQAEIDALRHDKATLQEALRMARLGDVDLQGHLSKFNPDAAEQGIFSQDWELRFFVLSGSLLKYYTSERDVGHKARGLLSLEGCVVEVEQPVSARGPFIFTINDPDGDTLLRLSADSLATAKTWVRTLHAVGLTVQGFGRLAAVASPGWPPQQQQQQGSQGPARSISLNRGFSSIGRALSGRWSNMHFPPNVVQGDSIDSEVSMTLQRLPFGLDHQQEASQQSQEADSSHADSATAAAADSSSSSGRKDTGAEASFQQQLLQPPAAPPQQQQQQQQQQYLGGDLRDADEVFSSEGEEGSHSARIRRRLRRLRSILHSRTGTVGVTTATSAAPGDITAAADSNSSGSSSNGGPQLGAAAAMAAAAAAAASGPVRGGFGGSNRHRRTLSAPLQKQVSWRWERIDRGDELPDSDSDDSDTEASSDTPELHFAPPPVSLQQQQQQPVCLQQQDGALLYDLQQQQQQQPPHQWPHAVLEGVQEQEEDDPPKRPQRISAFGAATEAATIAAAGGISDANPAAAAAAPAGVPSPPTPPPMPSSALSGTARSGFRPPSMASLKPQGTGVVKPKRGPMLGCSPVHVTAKDSILTEHDRHGVLRHEGFLNLGVVVLLATNIRMIIDNLMTYGLRLKFNQSVMQAMLPTLMSRDDVITLLATPLTCLLFALGALCIERLGLWMLLTQEQALQGLQKKELPAGDVAAQGKAIGKRHELVLYILNLINAGGSLVLPCCLVLNNKASLVPAFVLTVVAIVLSMKLATYAHCNTTLRREARARAVEAAAASLPVPSTPQNPTYITYPSSRPGSGTNSRHVSVTGHISRASLAPRSMLAPVGVLATAATATATATGWQDASTLRSSATDPSPFMASGLSRSGSISRRHAAGLAVGDITYPGNLTVGDLGYFLAAPTLTYQLNFPRLRQRRWRLLSRWLVLAVLTAIAMSFMQIQFLLPCMQSSLVPLREMNPLRFMERLLRLAVPNTAVWLAMFYLVFHLWLNILGEVLMFGDRVFYKEWWNAATLGDYWKLWNIPVHKWMLRTVFFPLVRRGAARMPSLLFVFFISAVMHELAVGVPLRMLRGWAFWGMMMQVPLVILTEILRKRLKADTLGNMVFWVSFCVLGQPMCLVLYYHDWLLANMGEQGWHAAAAEGEAAAARMASGVFNSTLSSVAGSMVY